MLSKWTMTEYQRSSFKASCLRELAPRAHHRWGNTSKKENTKVSPPTASTHIAEETATPAFDSAATEDAVESTFIRVEIHSLPWLMDAATV